MLKYTLIDASNDFASLSNNIGKFKIKLCRDYNIPYREEGLKLITPLDDIRFITLDTIQQYLLSLTAYVRGFMELGKRVDNIEEFLAILNLGVTMEQLEGREGKPGLLYKFPIVSLITMIHFQIDTYFGQICGSEKKFHRKITEIVSNNIESQNILLCLAYFRNSFHNGGSHLIQRVRWVNGIEPGIGTVDKIFESGEQKIEFKHRKTVSYNWKSVYLLVEASVKVLQKVIYDKSKEVL